ncbi:MAG: hypothetical protein EHM24_16440 [Acidobacteria bacterium]|nr:MAG: hypothetical protein EHM24_16440 [Acidobacteriota bacterium]
MESSNRVPRAAVAVVLAALAAVLAGACGGGSPATPSPPATTGPTVALTTTHFRILTDGADASVLRAVADALEANYPRVTDELRSGDLPVVDVWVWQNEAAYYADMQRYLGTVYQGSAGWVRGARGISVLVVSNTPLHAVHEFVHVVSLAVNPTFANNPRWLWETVALYENGQFVDPARLEYLQAGRFPTLADLTADYSTGRQVYEVGYVLGEFIVATWGMNGLLELIRANGALERVFQLTTGQFEQRFYAWLRARYLS